MKFSQFVKEFIGQNMQLSNKEIKKKLAKELYTNYSEIEIDEIKKSILKETE